MSFLPLTLDEPLWLLGLLAVPLVGVLGARAVARVRLRQHRVAAWVRAGAVALLVLALAGPRWEAAGRAVDVAFLVDASDSVGSTGTDAALDWVEQALAGKPEGDRAALALFGADPQIEYTLRPDPPTGTDVFTVVDPSASDLAQALRLGQGVLGSEHRRRAVLLTDGRQTEGDAVRAAEELAASGVQVDVVQLDAGLAADVLVEEVRAPSRVREGDAYDVAAVLRNTGAADADAEVTVLADGVEIDRRSVTVPTGTTEVVVPRTAEGPGTVRYEVRLASGASSLPANDVGRTAVNVDGPPSVLLVEGETGGGAELAAALSAADVPSETVGIDAGVPALDRLLEHDSVVLVDVSIDGLPDPALHALDAYVRDAGRGLVAVGGDDSYGVGGYDGTLLEDLLPVFARVKDPERRPSVAEALLVDVSGSMAACHCQEGGFGGGPDDMRMVEGGVSKTDISKEAIARAVAALEADDTVGVLAFNTQSEWVIPLQKLPSQGVVDAGLARLHPEGGTSVPQAVRQAIEGLKDVEARLRHIVLFTDGFTEDVALVEVAREAADAGITLSVVGTGEGPGDVLRDMAAAGGGRYYPGRDLASIPDIIVSEVLSVARPIINEGTFLPVVTGIGAATEGLESSPPLLGYLATTAKPTARTLLAIGDERDPLLATWQAGLGTAVAWTSDASPRWSANWVSWERFSRFWSDVVKATFPADPDPGYDVSVATTTEGVRVTLESADTVPPDAQAVVTVTAPDGTRSEVPLERTGLDTFASLVPGGEEGVYAVAVRLSEGDRDLFRDTVTAIRSYSPEYAAGAADTGLLGRTAAAGGGRVDPEPATAFAAAGLEPGSSSRTLWPWFALAGLVLLPVDVGLRRLRLERADARRAWRWLRTRRWRRPRVAERRDTTEGLLAAKQRARERQDDAP